MKHMSTSLMEAPLENLSENEMAAISGGGFLDLQIGASGTSSSGQGVISASLDFSNLFDSLFKGLSTSTSSSSSTSTTTSSLSSILNNLLGGLLGSSL